MSIRGEIINATIERTMLGVEDHGLLTACITLKYAGSSQVFGGYSFGSAGRPALSAVGMEFIRRVLKIAGVERWEDLKGRPVRADADHGTVYGIGHFIDGDFFYPREEFAALFPQEKVR